jgi:hypothetical protein
VWGITKRKAPRSPPIYARLAPSFGSLAAVCQGSIWGIGVSWHSMGNVVVGVKGALLFVDGFEAGSGCQRVHAYRVSWS